MRHGEEQQVTGFKLRQVTEAQQRVPAQIGMHGMRVAPRVRLRRNLRDLDLWVC